MAKKFLRFLTLAALLAFSNIAVRATDVTWTPGGGSGTGGAYLGATDDFVATVPPSSNILTLATGTIEVEGNLFIDATDNDITVDVAAGDVTFNPVSGGSIGFGNLVFYAPFGATINVEVTGGNLSFIGTNTHDMYVTFVGAGQTVFNIDGGLAVTFGSDGKNGTTVFVDMDQMQAEVDAGNNKVVFKRYVYTDPVNNYDLQPVDVFFGYYSNLIYLHNNEDIGDTQDDLGYAAVAFDPSNGACGPFALHIEDSAGVVVGGHLYWPDPSWSGVLLQDLQNAAQLDVSLGVYYNSHAGRRAILRVVDDFAAASETPPYTPSATTRRTLLIINTNGVHPLLGADPYWLGFENDPPPHQCDGYGAYGVQNVRTGFVIAANGELDVYHNRAVDYIAGFDFGFAPTVHDAFSILAGNPYNLPVTNDEFKFRTPSALIIDGLQLTTWYLDASGSNYPGLNQTMPNALITLRGDGSLHVSSAIGDQKISLHDDYIADNSGCYFWFGNVGVNSFDGNMIPGANSCIPSPEGIGVMDVEGYVDVRSLDTYPNYSPITKQGVLNLAPMPLDYKGVEVDFLYSSPDWYQVSVDRPLANGSWYSYRRSGHFFLNANMDLTDVTMLHNDVLKKVNDRPIETQPAIVGGEKKWMGLRIYSEWYDFPEIRLKNGTLHLNESLCASGMRWIVREASDNTSKFIFSNHGDERDMLFRHYGRVLMLGTPNNFPSYESDSQSQTYLQSNPNWVLTSAFVNVFRGEAPADDGEGGYVDSTIKLSLQTDYQMPEGATDPKQQATHLFLFTQGYHPFMENACIQGQPGYEELYLGGVSSLDLGWTTSRGDNLNQLFTFHGPWEGTTPHNSGIMLDIMQGVSPATVSIDGELILFDAKRYLTPTYYWDDGNCCLETRNDYYPSTAPGDLLDWWRWYYLQNPIKDIYSSLLGVWTQPCVYVCHGGKLTTSPYYNSIFNVPIATKLWYDYQSANWISTPELATPPKTQRITRLSGEVFLPHDQVMFGKDGGIQPYGWGQAITESSANTGGIIRLKVTDVDATGFDRKSGEEFTIDWAQRPFDSTFDPVRRIELSKRLCKSTKLVDRVGERLPYVGRGKKRKTVERVEKERKPSTHKRIARKTILTRSTEPVVSPVTLPTNLFYLGEGDHVTQLKVAGSTKADPIHIFCTGSRDTHGFAIVDEVVSVPSMFPVYDEYDPHGVIILDCDAQVGLGSRSWNEHSLNAWNKLGDDYVSIVPYGFGKIILNNDLIVADPNAILAAAGFGEQYDAEGVLVDDSFARLTFYSEDTHEIRVPAGYALDLSSFGRRTTGTADGSVRQEICIGGKTRLIFEQGSTLRFPSTLDEGVTFVLYLNDEAELIFEGVAEHNAEDPVYSDVSDANGDKTKILGKGAIWVNKDAKIKVNGAAWVAVQADAQTPTTNIEISIQRQGSFEIGNDNLAGGAFEVGNPIDTAETSVSFGFRLNGPKATVHIDREGFLGLGLGIVNKGGNMNGAALAANNTGLVINETTGLPEWDPDTISAWQVVPLYNVSNIWVNIYKGIWDHSNIFDGSDKRSSLFAISGEVLGSGDTPTQSWKFLYDDPNNCIIRGGGNTMYVPAGTAVTSVNMWNWAGPQTVGDSNAVVWYGILGSGPLTKQWVDGDFANSTVVQTANIGKQFTSGTGSAYDFFRFASYRPFNELPGKFVDIGETQFDVWVGYVDQNSYIQRIQDPPVIEGGLAIEGVDSGVLGATGADDPSQFISPGYYGR